MQPEIDYVKIGQRIKMARHYFLLDTPYAKRESIINVQIPDKLKKCNTTTLVTVSKIIDALLEQQNINDRLHSF